MGKKNATEVVEISGAREIDRDEFLGLMKSSNRKGKEKSPERLAIEEAIRQAAELGKSFVIDSTAGRPLNSLRGWTASILRGLDLHETVKVKVMVDGTLAIGLKE